MVDTPLDRLLEIGYEDLRRNQEEFKRVAAKIDPKRTPRADPARAREGPSRRPASCCRPFATCSAACASFVETQHIVTIPSPVPPIVEETPPFMRALTTASMDTPGAVREGRQGSVLQRDAAGGAGTQEQIEEYLAGFNRGTIISTAVHEVYPGHYTQFLWLAQRADQSSQADRLQLERRRLGALHASR